MGGRQRGNIGSASVRFISASPRGEKVARTDTPAKWVSSERSRSPGRARIGPAVVGLVPVSPRGKKVARTDTPAKWVSTERSRSPQRARVGSTVVGLVPVSPRGEKVARTDTPAKWVSSERSRSPSGPALVPRWSGWSPSVRGERKPLEQNYQQYGCQLMLLVPQLSPC